MVQYFTFRTYFSNFRLNSLDYLYFITPICNLVESESKDLEKKMVANTKDIDSTNP